VVSWLHIACQPRVGTSLDARPKARIILAFRARRRRIVFARRGLEPESTPRFPTENPMAVPKRKTSKSRSRTRQAHDALAIPQFARCSKTGRAMLPHTVCEETGLYGKGKVAFVVDFEKAAAPKKGAGGASEK